MQAVKNLILFVLVVVFGAALSQGDHSIGLVVVLIISAIFAYDSNSEAKKSHKLTDENSKHIQGLQSAITEIQKKIDVNFDTINGNFDSAHDAVNNLQNLGEKLAILFVKQSLEIKNAKRQPRGKSTTKNS